ncbi:MAG: hypothetical protein RIQ41_476 [Candidatus Parcubacteria bacterium]|jgi:uncharacterized protein (DUF305 family)
MKKHFNALHEKVEPWNLFIGIAIGIGVGLYIYSCVPFTARQHMGLFTVAHGVRLTQGEMGNVMFMGTNTSPAHIVASRGMTVTMASTEVTTDKEFVEQMIAHHEEGVRMAQHVLTLNPKETVKKLANDIIALQSDEIRMMKELLKNWDK